MGNKWSKVKPKPKTARILLAALFAFPILLSLILSLLPPYEGYARDFGPAIFVLPAILLVEFPIAGILASMIVVGSIFLWEWCRKSLLGAWLACWVWFSFTVFMVQYSAPFWYRRDGDGWGYTFAFERSWPVAGIIGTLFFPVGLLLTRIAFEPKGSTKAD
jgi:hypothetical protein